MSKKGPLRKEKHLIAFGKNLRQIRENKGLSMETLAAYSGVEYSQISRIERGLINTSISQVFAIADALEMPYNALFEFKVEE